MNKSPQSGDCRFERNFLMYNSPLNERCSVLYSIPYMLHGAEHALIYGACTLKITVALLQWFLYHRFRCIYGHAVVAWCDATFTPGIGRCEKQRKEAEELFWCCKRLSPSGLCQVQRSNTLGCASLMEGLVVNRARGCAVSVLQLFILGVFDTRALRSP